jgi:hypothetical protein
MPDSRCACSVPEPGHNIHPAIVEEKSKRASKWLGFLINVWFWSALTLTLNQRFPDGCGLSMESVRITTKLTSSN